MLFAKDEAFVASPGARGVSGVFSVLYAVRSQKLRKRCSALKYGARMETGGDGVVESVDAASPADAAGLRALPCVANFIELIFQQFRRDAHRKLR